MVMHIRRNPLLCFLMLLMTCGLAVAQQPAAGQQAETGSLLGVGDVVRITVYGQPDLTTVTRIGTNGIITFPLVGDLPVNGLSTTEAERELAGLLELRGIVRNAQINVFVQERGKAIANVTIIGEISRSGLYPLGDDTNTEGITTLVGLLAAAGGPTENASDQLFIIRGDRRIAVDLFRLLRFGEMESNVALSNRDVVLIPQMDVFYAYGQVVRPGRYRLERNMTVMQGLAVASGITDRGSDSRISASRRVDGKVVTGRVELADQLSPNDVIYVGESRF